MERDQEARCLICYEEGPDVLHLGCPGSHTFCGPCLTQWLTSGDPSALLDGAANLPHCPSCKQEKGPPGHIPLEVLPLLVARGHMTPEHEARFHRQYVRLTTSDTIYACINPVCDNQFAVEVADPQTAQRVYHDAFKVTCSSCSVVQCAACGVPWEPHAGLTCVKYRARAAPADEATRKLLAGSVPCPGKCGQGLQQSSGCNVLLCVACKLYVCYLCGEGLDSSKVDLARIGVHPTANKHYQVPGKPCYDAMFKPKAQWLKARTDQRLAGQAPAAVPPAGPAILPAAVLPQPEQEQQQQQPARRHVQPKKRRNNQQPAQEQPVQQQQQQQQQQPERQQQQQQQKQKQQPPQWLLGADQMAAAAAAGIAAAQAPVAAAQAIAPEQVPLFGFDQEPERQQVLPRKRPPQHAQAQQVQGQQVAAFGAPQLPMRAFEKQQPAPAPAAGGGVQLDAAVQDLTARQAQAKQDQLQDQERQLSQLRRDFMTRDTALQEQIRLLEERMEQRHAACTADRLANRLQKQRHMLAEYTQLTSDMESSHARQRRELAQQHAEELQNLHWQYEDAAAQQQRRQRQQRQHAKKQRQKQRRQEQRRQQQAVAQQAAAQPAAPLFLQQPEHGQQQAVPVFGAAGPEAVLRQWQQQQQQQPAPQIQQHQQPAFGQRAGFGFGQHAGFGFGQQAGFGFGQRAGFAFGQRAGFGFGQHAGFGFGQQAGVGFGQPAAARFVFRQQRPQPQQQRGFLG